MKKCLACKKKLTPQEEKFCNTCSAFLFSKHKERYSARLKELEDFFEPSRKKLNSGGKK